MGEGQCVEAAARWERSTQYRRLGAGTSQVEGKCEKKAAASVCKLALVIIVKEMCVYRVLKAT